MSCVLGSPAFPMHYSLRERHDMHYLSKVLPRRHIVFLSGGLQYMVSFRGISSHGCFSCRSVVLNLDHAPESPGGLVKPQVVGA